MAREKKATTFGCDVADVAEYLPRPCTPIGRSDLMLLRSGDDLRVNRKKEPDETNPTVSSFF